MPLAKSIFPIWCELANSMHSTKIDMLIRDIFIMTSAIIISTMDIQRVRTTTLQSCSSFKDLVPNILMHSSSSILAQLSESLFS